MEELVRMHESLDHVRMTLSLTGNVTSMLSYAQARSSQFSLRPSGYRFGSTHSNIYAEESSRLARYFLSKALNDKPQL